ncbi:MAG: TolC family protein, partial [Planctomycetota bacterium]
IIDDTDLPGAPDPGDDAWNVMLGIRIPLWWNRRDAAVEESRNRLEADRLALRQLEHDTRYEVTDLYYRLQIALRQVKLYRDTVLPQTRQAFEVSRTAYSAVPAKIDFEGMIDNYRRLLMFQLALERSRTDFQQRKAELERIVGGSLSEVER